MDRKLEPDICGSVLEFLVLNSADDLLVKKLINAFPQFTPSPRLVKAINLRSIQTEIQAGEITENILDYLETVARLHRKQRLQIPDSIKEAYCAVALDCSAKYLAGDTNPDGPYLDAVNRIWRNRVEGLERSGMSDLVSDQLRNRRRQVEAVFEDDEVRRRLIAINTRSEAILSLRLYMREALASMNPSVLERVSSRAKLLPS
ncbi:uncharacterized protein LOC120134834 [Hibiscus syriacus]|uniref:uncharacterized protein LOC120134834 n=1 Tax=Hibiscus syriacus TaxID=106335 RepID=UPI001921E459|nr:uncharacterized protein LOC120134834 [Hibiscus syriacus]